MAYQPKMVKASGKTMEEAIQNACELLGATPDQIDVEVIQDGSSGFLRIITGKTIRIRAVLRPEYHKEVPKGFTFYSKEALRRIEEEALPTELGKAPDLTNPREVLAVICGMILPGTRVERFQRKDHVLLRIVGDGSGLFIGNRGETLDALQYLVNKIVHKATGDESIKIVVDSENYRTRKEDRIEHLARRLAQRVRETGKPATTEPLSAYDRRKVHLTVAELGGLATESVGEGDRKRVQIFLASSAPAPAPRASEGQVADRPAGETRRPRRRRGRRGGTGRADSSAAPPRREPHAPAAPAAAGSGRRRGRRRSGRKPVFLEDQPAGTEVRGVDGFDQDLVPDHEPIPELVVEKRREDEE